jgi:hypothetical protein
MFCEEEEKNAADLDPLFPFFLHEWTFPSRSYLTPILSRTRNVGPLTLWSTEQSTTITDVEFTVLESDPAFPPTAELATERRVA